MRLGGEIVLLSILSSCITLTVCTSSACIDGYCAMSACPRASGSSRSSYCWMSGNEGGYDKCGGNEECESAVKNGGACKALSCGFNRAPIPDRKNTCGYKNAKTLSDLNNECSADGKTFDSWTQTYHTAQDLYNKFQPCTGRVIEEEVKKSVHFCYCYNFCGAGQTRDGCVVDGLEGRLDLGANLFSSYKAVCKIDCKPVDKLEKISTLRNELSDETITKKVTITEGTTSTKTSSHGGSTTHTISTSVSLSLKDIFSADVGYSKDTGYDWSQSTSSSFSRQVSHEVSVPVKPGDVVSVYQVVGVCDNSDGTLYTVNTKTLVVRDKDGGSTEVVAE